MWRTGSVAGAGPTAAAAVSRLGVGPAAATAAALEQEVMSHVAATF